jgi:hypothetical protein
MRRARVVRGFDCTLLELDVIGDALELDLRRFPFQFPVHGDVVADRLRLIDAAHETLTGKGLIEGRRFTPDLEDLLGLFARGTLSVAVVGTVDSGPDSTQDGSADAAGLCARAVTDGRSGVLAVQHGQFIAFDPVTPASLVRSVVALLPPMRPGPGRSATITVDQPVSAGRHRRDEDLSHRRYLEAVRPSANSAVSQQGVVAGIMRRERLGSGYVTVTARDRHGHDGEPLTMSWLDTDLGRYAVLPTIGPDGRHHVTYSPADLGRFEHTLARLVELAN